MRRAPLRFFSPQRIRVNASLDATFAAMTAFGRTATKPGESHAEVLARGQRLPHPLHDLHRQEPVRHRGGGDGLPAEHRHVPPPLRPARDVYEVFTAMPRGEAVMLVNYMGQYRNRRFDLPLLGRLIHRFAVLPRYDPIIAGHLAEVKRRAEARRS